MTVRRISSTDASRSFSDVLNRVKYAGEEFLVERAGVALCRIVPVDKVEPLTLEGLAQMIEAHGADPEFADAIEEATKLRNAPVVPEDPWKR